MHLTHQSDSKSIITKDRRDKATNEGVSLPSRTIVHAKLEMTSPQDAEEIEADDMANAIVSGGKIKRKISQGITGWSGIAVSSQMEGELSRLQGSGRQMPAGLRNMMENGFGRDFSQVRLHTDSDAASMSSSIHAKAFTLGNDIYFNQGQYSPETTEGQRLVAHELTHVAQGNGKVSREEEGKAEENSVDEEIVEQDNKWNELWDRYPKDYNRSEKSVASYFKVVADSDFLFDNLNYKFFKKYKKAIKRKGKNGKNGDDGELNNFEDNLILVAKKNNLESGDINSFVDFFYNHIDFFYKYKNDLRNINNREDWRSNVARVFFLYGENFFLKKHRPLTQYVNGCGVRLSIALAKAGLKINGARDFKGKGHDFFEIANEFNVLGGPSSFEKQLNSVYKKDNKPTVTLTPDDFFNEDGSKKYGNQKDALHNAEEKIKRAFINRRGIIVMKTNVWSNAGGHVTLWDGYVDNNDKMKGAVDDDLDVNFLDHELGYNRKPKYQTYTLYEFDMKKFKSIK